MLETTFQTDPRIALAIYIALVFVTIAGILLIARWMRERRGPKPGSGIYESGAPARPAMTSPVSAGYFQIAAFFVIFDFEAAVLYTWAISVKQAGIPGLISASVFICVLLAALIYLWADGALDTGPVKRDRHP